MKRQQGYVLTCTDARGKTNSFISDANGMVSSYTLGDPAGTGATAGLLRSIQRDAAGRITGYTHTNGDNPGGNGGKRGSDSNFVHRRLPLQRHALKSSRVRGKAAEK